MPDNPFAKELERRGGGSPNPFAAEIERREKTPSANYAFRDRFSRSFLNNLMAVPDVSGELAANAIDAGRALVPYAAGAGPRFIRHLMGDKTPSPTLGERYAEAKETEGVLPAFLRSIPRPSTEKTDAAAESIPSLLPGGESPGRAY